MAGRVRDCSGDGLSEIAVFDKDGGYWYAYSLQSGRKVKNKEGMCDAMGNERPFSSPCDIRGCWSERRWC